MTLQGEPVHTDGEAYERFMGRWSRRLAPVFLDFVGVPDGQSVLDVGSGIGAVAGAVLSTTQTSRVMAARGSPSVRRLRRRWDAQESRHPAERYVRMS